VQPWSSEGDERLLLNAGPEFKYATSSSRDGRFLLYTVENSKTKSDLLVLPLTGDRKPIPFLRTEFNERSGQFSPDGKLIAYISDESGNDEIYVRDFSPGPAQGSWDAGAKWLISKGGGTDPDGAGMAKNCSMWLPTGGLCQSTSVPTRCLRQERRGLCSNYRLVS
jgi:Tol biopolymer transport system component